MNTLQIEYFLLVAKTGSFSAAAQDMYVSQPAVSKQIAALEKEIGLKLLERHASGVRLTEAGRLFYGYFLQTAQDFKQTLNLARQLTPDAPMQLNFGVVEDWDISGFIPQTVAALQKRFPRLQIHFFSRNSVQTLRELQKGKMDLILYSPMFLDDADMEGLEEHFVTKSRMIALFSATHPLANKADLQLRDFAEEPFFLCDRNRDTNAVIEKVKLFCRLNGFEPKLEHCGKREDLFLQLQTGHGYTLFHEMVRIKENPSFRYIFPEIEDHYGLRQEICLYHKKDNQNPALPIVIQEISNILQKK